MKLLNLFGRKTDTPPPEIENDEDELEIYSGMRVEVTAFDGRMLFVAKLMGLRGNQAELHQYLEAAISQVEEPLPVRIRGYSDRDRKAVYMEGVIAPLSQDKWSVEDLKVKLLEDRPESAMFTQIVRIIEKGDAGFEYGCRFLELTEADQEQITQNIFAAQRQKRGRS